ncbi:MAG: DegT/DnrJ/EryC1/StrS family aminotransferase [Candidatus Saccharibacteria bacterium]|nr:DegT/DnrJ/EryC1/StrS family aminotransferase [Candidatus Saccharibacteria bacterium]
MPPVEEYGEYIRRIWANGQITNQGPLLQEFDTKVKDHLGVEYFHFVTNGTLALQIALRALDINDGEIITTPFSYVATVSSILWERCTPVFVDIEPETFCIDVNKIEEAITSKTKAILGVHVFGNPCDVEAIQSLAAKHHLKVIYDGAHAFGVTYRGKSLLGYGDISTCSFHATKLFHTIEGGAVIVNRKELSDKVDLIKQFGHKGDEHFMLGINAKASEVQAAMGLCNLKYVDEIIKARKIASNLYTELLGDSVRIPISREGVDYNYAYYPVLFKTEEQLIKKIKRLNEANIYPRRYFYPSLNKLSYLQEIQSCPVSEDIASRVACLPLYVGLSNEIIEKIARIVNEK